VHWTPFAVTFKGPEVHQLNKQSALQITQMQLTDANSCTISTEIF